MEVQRFYPKRCSRSRSRSRSSSISSSTSTETIANMDELLLRVPARKLVRFKCVSKHWLSLISDPKFCHRHTLRNSKPSVSAIFYFKSKYFSYIPLVHDHDHDHDHNSNPSDSAGRPNCNPLNFVPHIHGGVMIIQSCNGLFLCEPPNTTETTFDVLNPTTNKFSTLVLPAAAVASVGHWSTIYAPRLCFGFRPFQIISLQGAFPSEH